MCCAAPLSERIRNEPRPNFGTTEGRRRRSLVKGMEKLSDRITHPVDWLKATEAERARLYHVAKAVMDVTCRTPADFYRASLGKAVDPVTTSGNFSRGKIARRHAAMIHAWIEEHHPDIGLRIAPELFLKPARSSWQELLGDRAQYGELTVLRLSALGLVQPASRFPVDDRPLTLGEPFAFSLRCDCDGQVFAFQETRGFWHLFSLGEDPHSFIRPCQEGKHVLPSHDDGSPLPIIEAETDGLHSFVFVQCGADTDVDLAPYAGLALRPEQLDALSMSLLSRDGALLAIHRLNVRFVR
jgi:hypothetical protein